MNVTINDLKDIFLRYAAKSDKFISTEKMLNETETNTLPLVLINQTFEVLIALDYIKVHKQMCMELTCQ